MMQKCAKSASADILNLRAFEILQITANKVT